MTAVVVEKLEALDHPGVEAAREMAGHLAHDVLTIAKPRQLRMRGSGPHRFLAFFAMVSVAQEASALQRPDGS
jgi:hypothetical protein